MEEEEQKKPIDNMPNSSSTRTKQPSLLDVNVENNTDSVAESSNSSKKQKTTEEIHSNPISSQHTVESKPESSKIIKTATHYQDILFNEKNTSYCSFSTTNKKPTVSVSTTNQNPESTESKPIHKLLGQASTVATDQDSDEDEQRKKIAAAKKLLFPDALATSFPEVVDTLRNERRQEFCPIYQNETPEQTALRRQKQKPVGSLLSKRIRWDELKRKREAEERKAQMQFSYGPYGPVYANQQFQQSFANPYEQYYAAVQSQYENMVQRTRAQQDHSGFWPEHQQQSYLQNNDRIAQNSMQPQMQPYTYPYSTMYTNNTTGTTTNTSSSYASVNQDSYYQNIRQPPPPPPDEPYPY
ncbi:unnamed protein product [Rotaria magnacalcarata]|uniref:Uncharacterized protein n=7 Tax=Rotaria magnacalcarata TaxID=392030 RepID=A0A816NE98_9BILA|nr:unnamed protein product [Rotaria magnacalcarata]CAF1683296.1 unnamed protein product [Rotaria magnacalcarata]CAF2034979.1 unnamed protein product [Rotaria magnacalcarata]CAF2100832.1 unnamed protein product [Rotaria magnacalcarata]CAF2135302.1 unnamed protein product [Rotaria magnacalcarata]